MSEMDDFFASLTGETDYEIYLRTMDLFSCQKTYAQCCNEDEMQFQIVHQVEELWMKLISYTLFEIKQCMEKEETNRVVGLFKGIHCVQELMFQQLSLLETMSPQKYTEIRKLLSNGSGFSSPGMSALKSIARSLWDVYKEHYLDGRGETLISIYSRHSQNSDSYVIAECLLDFDEMVNKFRYHHVKLIHRSIGVDAMSLTDRSITHLYSLIEKHFFPELWKVRTEAA